MNQQPSNETIFQPLKKRRITGVELAAYILVKSLRTWRFAIEKGLEDGPTKKLNLILVRHLTGVVKAWETWRIETRSPPINVDTNKSTLAQPAGVSLLERVEYKNQQQKTRRRTK